MIHGQQPFPNRVVKSIFFLGPIPRTADTKHLSWKPEACRILGELGFDGTVYDPEWEETPDQSPADYDNSPQIDWEVEAMNRADVIVAWIAREFPAMPAMTSNIELGEWFKSGKLILGYPEHTPKMGYITYRATEWLEKICQWEVPVYHDLRELLTAAVLRIGEGALRVGAEVTIPLDIWKDKTFKQWYYAQQLGGHNLEDFRVEYVFYRRVNCYNRPKQKVWVARPRVKIAEENRIKDNEVVVGRPATVSVLMYCPRGNSILGWDIVLVKEYRPAVINQKGFVYELPGGSIEPLEGPHDEKVILGSAMREVEEELRMPLDASRLIKFDIRQGLATLVACEHHLYTYQLDSTEIIRPYLMGDLGLSRGDLEAIRSSGSRQPIQDNAEYTLPVVVTVGDLLASDSLPLDWVNMGMIMKFVAQEQNRLGILPRAI